VTAGQHSQAAYSPAEAAGQLSISRSTLYGLISAGQLRRVKIGRRTLIPATEIDRLLNEGATTLRAVR